MYKESEIMIANKTCRNNGASAFSNDGSIRAIVPRYIEQHIQQDKIILDFGSGKRAIHTQYLRERGYDVTAYDFGDNCIDGVHDKDALLKHFDVVFASNVLNVSSNKEMLEDTLKDIAECIGNNGTAIFNYPSSPRKACMETKEVEDIVKEVFSNVVQVGGTKSAPIWEASQTIQN